MELRTRRLRIVLQTKEEVEQVIAALSEDEKAQISPVWLARMRASTQADPWVHSFRVVHWDTDAVIGTCGFKGPPENGVVEISYGIDPGHQGNGYATEAAQALVDYAFSHAEVRLVTAHTLPNSPASKRVLLKCGFRDVGETMDPEDGAVSRFEMAIGDNARTA